MSDTCTATRKSFTDDECLRCDCIWEGDKEMLQVKPRLDLATYWKATCWCWELRWSFWLRMETSEAVGNERHWIRANSVSILGPIHPPLPSFFIFSAPSSAIHTRPPFSLHQPGHRCHGNCGRAPPSPSAPQSLCKCYLGLTVTACKIILQARGQVIKLNFRPVDQMSTVHERWIKRGGNGGSGGCCGKG